ncbi:10002_t:CDS:2 [Rhizophagus irregularis]|nr:10002_t:CDS:2 [Rhizophagus irregularis]
MENANVGNVPNNVIANLSNPPIPRTSKASKVPPKQSQSDQLIPLWKKLSKGKRKCQEVIVKSIQKELGPRYLELTCLGINVFRYKAQQGEHQMDCYNIFGSGTCPISVSTWQHGGLIAKEIKNIMYFTMKSKNLESHLMRR